MGALKSLIKYAVITVASIAAGIVLFIAYDVWENPYHRVRDIFRTPQYSMFQPDPELGYVTRPGTSLDIRGPNGTIEVHFDSLGSRVANVGEGTPPRVDLLAVGCSQTYGYGVPAASTFASSVGRRENMTVANFGVSGYSGVSALLLLLRHIELRPKIIVYGFWEDHLNRNVAPCLESGTPFCIERTAVRFDREGKPIILYPEDAKNALALAGKWFASQDGDPWYKDIVEDVVVSTLRLRRAFEEKFAFGGSRTEKLRAAEYVLSEMKATADSIGARMIVVYMPVYFYDQIEPAPQELVTFSRAHDITFLSMTPKFRQMKEAGIPIAIPGDGHMTELAHRAVADEIVAAIDRTGAENERAEPAHPLAQRGTDAN